ncbi:hypothetical protein NHF40_12535 [Maricaulaceae bacterium EIL42A08]|nr:hypothetical protein [Maricaulaceae bacterium EIL42A08]
MKQNITFEGRALPVRLYRVPTRPGALKLSASGSMSPEALLAVSAWLKAEAEAVIADREASRSSASN